MLDDVLKIATLPEIAAGTTSAGAVSRFGRIGGPSIPPLREQFWASTQLCYGQGK